MPDIIENENDFYYFQANKTKPNFISNKKTISKSTYILKESSNLNNKIILIENADPGYDWLFSKGISGLITKYGEPILIWQLDQLKLEYLQLLG